MNILNFLTSLLSFCCICYAKTNNCPKINLQLSQNIENEGFHRVSNWLLEILPNETKTISKCHLMVFKHMNGGMFVNADEILSLNKSTKFKIQVEGNVSVESFAHESPDHLVYIYLPEVDLKNNIRMPFHLRYQRAQITGKYGKVQFRKPSVLIRCPALNCPKESKVKAPCGFGSLEICSWQNYTYQALYDDVELFIPIGDLDDYPLVSIVTLLLGCTGCIYILSILSTASL